MPPTDGSSYYGAITAAINEIATDEIDKNGGGEQYNDAGQHSGEEFLEHVQRQSNSADQFCEDDEDGEVNMQRRGEYAKIPNRQHESLKRHYFHYADRGEVQADAYGKDPLDIIHNRSP